MRLFAGTIRKHAAARQRRRHVGSGFGLTVELLEERRVLSADHTLELHEPVDLATPLLPSAIVGVAAADGSPSHSETSTPPHGWPQTGGPGTPVTITYSYSNLLDGRLQGNLSPDQLRYAVETALRLWASVAPLDFVEVPDAGPPPSQNEYPADGLPMIRIGRASIDGNGGSDTLALSWFPGTGGLAGDVHFDGDNLWRFGDSGPASDFFEVALHELGHAIGLEHVPSVGDGGVQSIMNPRHGRWFPDGPAGGFLFDADVAQVRSIYGAGNGSVTPLPQPVPADADAPATSPQAAAPQSVLAVRTEPTVLPLRERAVPELSLVVTHLPDRRSHTAEPRSDVRPPPDRRLFANGNADDAGLWSW